MQFVNTCISAYFIAVIALIQFLKKFSILPLVRDSFARGATTFQRFLCDFGAFFAHAFRLISLLCMQLFQFIRKTKFLMLPFSSLFIRQGASLNFGVFYAIFGAFFPHVFRFSL